MHRHGPAPLLASLSKCLKDPVTTGPRHVRHESTKPRRPVKQSFWASQALSKDSGPGPSTWSMGGSVDSKPELPPNPIKLTRQVMQRQSSGRDKWEKTSILRGEERRLKSAIQMADTPPGRESKEKQAFFATSESQAVSEEDEFASVVNIAPGSLVETRRNDIETLGIVLGTTYNLKRLHYVTMTSSGETWKHRPADVTFVVPSCVPTSLAERCGTEDVPESDHHLHARMEVLQQLRKTIRTLEEKYNHMWANEPDIYSQVRSPYPDTWAETSVEEIVNMLERNPKMPAVYATHRYLMSNSLQFVPRDPYIISQTFDVRPSHQVAEIKKVVEWKRVVDGPLQDFARRARPVLEANQSRLKAHTNSPPTQTKSSATWTNDDKVILSFLLHSLRPHRSMQADPYAIGQVAIMRLLYPDWPVIEEHHVHDTLVDLGAIAPWQDLTVLDKRFVPEPEADPQSQRVKDIEALVHRSLSNAAKPIGGPLGPEDFYASDVLESVRHDWGNLQAFVIDDATAKELDDAVSIEPVKNENGRYWLHTHIANPTAVLPPTHALARRALKDGVTRYLIHHTIPLFPQSLTHSAESGWSLGSTLTSGEPTRVMTFSAKVDSKGNIYDYRIRAGLLKNLHVVSYSAVDKVLGYHDKDLKHPFGKPVTATPSEEPTFSEEECESLRLLDKIAKGLRRHRYESGAVALTQHTSELKLGPFPPGSMTPNMRFDYQGFPEFTEYSITRTDSAEYGARGLVSEAMKTASRVASRFGQDHGLPLIRRAVEPIVFLDESAREKALSLRAESSSVLMSELSPLYDSISPAEYTLEPKRHALLGVPEGEGYVRVTSPLRRSLDLVAHWQIQNALLGIREPIFDRDWMGSYKNTFAVTERQQKTIETTHQQFWRLMFIKRWLDGHFPGFGDQKAPVPDTFTGFVTEVGRHHALTPYVQSSVTIPSLGLAGVVAARMVDPQLVPGQQVSLKVNEIRLGVRPRIKFVQA